MYLFLIAAFCWPALLNWLETFFSSFRLFEVLYLPVFSDWWRTDAKYMLATWSSEDFLLQQVNNAGPCLFCQSWWGFACPECFKHDAVWWSWWFPLYSWYLTIWYHSAHHYWRAFRCLGATAPISWLVKCCPSVQIQEYVRRWLRHLEPVWRNVASSLSSSPWQKCLWFCSFIYLRKRTRLVLSDYYISKMETMLHDVDVLGWRVLFWWRTFCLHICSQFATIFFGRCLVVQRRSFAFSCSWFSNVNDGYLLFSCDI